MGLLVDQLKSGGQVIAAELRPPRAELATAASMDAWIDTYHAVRGLTRSGTFVFLTDSAVGMKEEDNLRHLIINLGSDVPRSRVVPFLTDMVRIAPTTFVMGTDKEGKGDGPAHSVTITRPFYLDRTEVTAEAYGVCIEEGACA